jgi:hypothetical protein
MSASSDSKGFNEALESVYQRALEDKLAAKNGWGVACYPVMLQGVFHGAFLIG